MTLLSIGLLATAERFEFQARREREEEFIHRGVEYSRAIRKYVKRFGRYPTSLAVLENSNDTRFLRKRYKDPLTGKDFKLLYYGDVPALSGNSPTGASPASSVSAAAPMAQFGGAGPSSATVQNSAVAKQSNDASASTQSTDDSTIQQVLAQLPSPAESEPSQVEPADPSENDTGRPIVGVASFSTKTTIRVFNKKNHYNQWQFIYDPSTDLGPMKGPNQPLLQGAGQTQPLLNGQGSGQNSGLNGGQLNGGQK